MSLGMRLFGVITGIVMVALSVVIVNLTHSAVWFFIWPMTLTGAVCALGALIASG